MITNKEILCISDLCWDEHWSVEQQFMSRLSQYNRVLYIERPISVITPFKPFGYEHSRRQISHWLRGGIRKQGENLYLATPPPILPFRYDDNVSKINSYILIKWIQQLLNKLKFSLPIMWVYEISGATIIESKIPHSLLIYHCLDTWAGRANWWNSRAAIEKQEKKLAARSDIIFAVSKSLVDDKLKYNPNTFYVPNGADFKHFSKAMNEDVGIPIEIKNIKHPVVGFIGVIGSRFDVDTMIYAANQRSNWTFLFVGPVANKDKGIDELRKLSNVIFVGMKSIADLPSYLSTMDVCTIPYRLNDFTDNCFPLKLFEYLSAGKPIVTTNIRSLQDYPEFVLCSTNMEEFLSNLEKALSNKNQLMVERRIKLAEKNSWEERIETATRIIEDKLSSK